MPTLKPEKELLTLRNPDLKKFHQDTRMNTLFTIAGSLLKNAKKEEHEKISNVFPDVIICLFLRHPRGRAQGRPRQTGA
jgi:hypothetical protein